MTAKAKTSNSEQGVTPPPAWQHPFVNVFKHCGLDKWKDVHKEGEVRTIMDRFIGKIVIQITGSVPAANFIQVPKSRNHNLKLTGRFLYTQVCVNPYNYFIIHLDVMSMDDNVHRVTISNMFKAQASKRNARSISVPLLNASHKWSVWAIDMAALLRTKTSSPFQCLRGIQMCASMLIRGLYTSDTKYSLKSLPRDMSMSHALEPSVFDMLWIPTEPEESEDILKNGGAIVRKQPGNPSSRPASRSVPQPIQRSMRRSPRSQGGEWKYREARSHQDDQISTASPLPDGREEVLEELDEPVDCSPLMHLLRINGYTGEYANCMTWAPNCDELVLAASSIIVIMKADGKSQRHLMGHTAPVCCLSMDMEGVILATGQEGCDPVIRVWNFKTGQCWGILQGHKSGLIDVHVSRDGNRLLAVGLDKQHRQTIILWDLKGVKHGDAAHVILHQSSGYNIKCMQWSAYDDDNLISCGKDSVRMYRIKGDKLRGMSIKLGTPNKKVRALSHTRQSSMAPQIFTAMAFEVISNPFQKERHVYVASAAGAVFQINYEKRCLDCIYQVHNGAINCLAISEGFCVLGSDDRFLRVWPLDFSDYFLEAENEAPVTSVGLSPDGLKLCVGTESGAIGVLDIATHSHSTLLRSHSDTINCVAASPKGTEFCTASSDGSVRIWSFPNFTQMYEFDAPGERAECVSYHPTGIILAAGFSEGLLRVFDVQGTTLVQECSQHEGVVCSVEFSKEGEKLYSLGIDGNVCMYDTLNNYRPIKYISVSQPAPELSLAISKNSEWLGTMSYKSDSSNGRVLVFHAPTLDPCLSIETSSRGFSRLEFTPDNRELWAVASAPPSIIRFDVGTGQTLGTISTEHNEGCSALEFDPLMRCFWTGGYDGILKIWTYPQGTSPPVSQSFAGHHDTITGIKVFGDHVVSVGYCDAIYVWVMQRPPESQARGSKGKVDRCIKSLEANIPQECPSPLTRPEQEATSPTPKRTKEKGLSTLTQNPRIHGVQCECIHGVSGQVPKGAVWHPETGFFAYVSDNLVVVEDLNSREQCLLRHHCQSVTGLCLSADGKLLASGSGGVEISGHADVCVWEAASRRMVGLMQYHSCGVQALDFSPDSCWLVSTGRDPDTSVVVWDVASCEVVAVGRATHTSFAACWCGSSSEPEFVTVGGYGALIWTLESTQLRQAALVLPSEALDAACRAVHCDNMGSIFLGDSKGNVWALANEGPACERAVDLRGEEITCVFKCGSRLAVGTSKGTLGVYQSGENNSWTLDAMFKLDGSVSSLEFDPCLNEGVASTSGCTVWYINAKENASSPLLAAHPTDVIALATSEQPPLILGSVSKDGVLRIWRKNETSAFLEVRSAQKCTSLQVSPSGKRCAAGYEDGTLKCFDTSDGKTQWTTVRHSGTVVGIGFNQDETMLMSASCDGAVSVCDAETSRLVHNCGDLRAESNSLVDIVLSRDGSLCAAAWPNKLTVFDAPWDKPNCTMKSTFRCSKATNAPNQTACASFSASHRNVVLYSSSSLEGRVIFFDARKSRATRYVDLPTGSITALRVSWNGVWVAAGSIGGKLFLLDYATGECQEVEGHRCSVQAVRFSLCDTELISVGGNMLKTWAI